ncbi:cuticle protein 38-like [Diachasma alloeum]|uniref:cuticle protein 38-like n=1 Tax=Diachasma alloeum TaxID=454923 RepID=UPI0007384F11|nr:cuticle protein 38-like [Diachasma alloeum]
MYKLVVLFALVACSMAAPAPKPGYVAAAPLVASPAVAVAHHVPVATSYANTYKVSYNSPLVASSYVAAPAVAYAAPAVHAPVVAAHHAYAPALAYAAHPAPFVAHY